MNESPYVVSVTVDGTGEKRYVGYDPDCGFLLERNSLSGAHLFKNFSDAEKIYKEILDGKPSVSGLTEYPPHQIHRGLKICNDRPTASGVLGIEAVVLERVRSKNVSGRIRHGKAVFD